MVPIAEVDHWVDLEPDLAAHLMVISQHLAQAIQQAFEPVRVGLMIAGLEVPHTHLHLVPISGVHDLDFANADPSPDPAALDAAADRIRDALSGLGPAPVR